MRRRNRGDRIFDLHAPTPISFTTLPILSTPLLARSSCFFAFLLSQLLAPRSLFSRHPFFPSSMKGASSLSSMYRAPPSSTCIFLSSFPAFFSPTPSPPPFPLFSSFLPHSLAFGAPSLFYLRQTSPFRFSFFILQLPLITPTSFTPQFCASYLFSLSTVRACTRAGSARRCPVLLH